MRAFFVLLLILAGATVSFGQSLTGGSVALFYPVTLAPTCPDFVREEFHDLLRQKLLERGLRLSLQEDITQEYEKRRLDMQLPLPGTEHRYFLQNLQVANLILPCLTEVHISQDSPRPSENREWRFRLVGWIQIVSAEGEPQKMILFDESLRIPLEFGTSFSKESKIAMRKGKIRELISQVIAKHLKGL